MPTARPSRRGLLRLGAAAGATLALGGSRLLARPPASASLPRRATSATGQAPRTHDLVFRAAERRARLLGPGGPETPVWSYTDTLLPVIRVQQKDRLRVLLRNELPEHTSVHWHGVRVPNAMDGVQFVTQAPVQPGQEFSYEFALPDTGTFFFHPHCNESGQVGHGLAGVLIVEGDEIRRPEQDIVVVVKDWRLTPDGHYLDFTTPAGAARAGTFGTVRSANGETSFARDVPPGSDIRVRLLNLDPTRVMDVGVEGGEAAIIAIDGHPVAPVPLDRTGLETWRLGPAMRVDLLVRVPATGKVDLIDFFSAEPWTIASLRAAGTARAKRRFDPSILSASDIPAADLSRAERLPFTFSAASSSIASFAEDFDPNDPLSKVLLDSLCVRDATYWSINKLSWPSGDHRQLPPPLATLKAGRSYVFELTNATPHPHPVHFHGHVFEVLSSSRARLPRFHADTVMLSPKERVEIAFVAAPGEWMLHCHILEHLEFGMMGIVRVVA